MSGTVIVAPQTKRPALVAASASTPLLLQPQCAVVRVLRRPPMQITPIRQVRSPSTTIQSLLLLRSIPAAAANVRALPVHLRQNAGKLEPLLPSRAAATADHHSHLFSPPPYRHPPRPPYTPKSHPFIPLRLSLALAARADSTAVALGAWSTAGPSMPQRRTKIARTVARVSTTHMGLHFPRHLASGLRCRHRRWSQTQIRVLSTRSLLVPPLPFPHRRPCALQQPRVHSTPRTSRYIHIACLRANGNDWMSMALRLGWSDFPNSSAVLVDAGVSAIPADVARTVTAVVPQTNRGRRRPQCRRQRLLLKRASRYHRFP